MNQNERKTIKALETTREMIVQRGFKLSEDPDDEKIIGTNKDGEQIIIFTKPVSKFNIDRVEEYISFVHNMKMYHCIVIYIDSITPMAKKLVEEFGGEIPDTVNELIRLPGVGRKTANVITSVIWNQPNMAVDTHVFRVSKRLGLVPISAKTPFEVEMQLTKHLPKEVIHKAHHWLILHGRYTCLARSPKCDSCTITYVCRFFEKNQREMENKRNKSTKTA